MKPTLFNNLDQLKKPSDTDFYTTCQVGHASHAVKKAAIKIDIMHPLYRYGGLPELFEIMVYDWREHFTEKDGNATTPKYKEYCTGQDVISWSIDTLGIWEEFESRLVVDILRSKQEKHELGVVLDFGSHIGWYSILAGLLGYSVAAIDANNENLANVARSAALNGIEDKIWPTLAWLDKDAPQLTPDAEKVRLLKADVEGAEAQVVRMADKLFAAGKVQNAILEISPVFNGSYPDLVEKIIGHGYRAYQIPTAHNWRHVEEFYRSPLETVLKYCELPVDNRRGYVENLHQENFLFRKEQS